MQKGLCARCLIASGVLLQVGNYTTDQDYWGRPEDYTLARPYYIAGDDIGATNLAATMTSALAATATVWKSSDTAYYTTLMTAAVELYTYATKILGPYGAIVSASTLPLLDVTCILSVKQLKQLKTAQLRHLFGFSQIGQMPASTCLLCSPLLLV